MTDPHDDPDRPDRPGQPDDDAGDDAATRRVRELLRDEPVDDDELARERRLRVALAAAVPPAHRAAPRRWLTAAAIVAIMGVGGYVMVTVGTGASDENASNDAAVATDDLSGADGGSGAAGPEPESAGRSAAPDAPPTTATGMQQDATGAPSASGVDASVVDLGPLESIAAAVAAAQALEDRTADADATLPRRIPDEAALRCIDQQRALGLEVIAVATLDGRDLVVLRSPAGPLPLDAATCTPGEP